MGYGAHVKLRERGAGPVALVAALCLAVVLVVCGGGALALYLINGHHGSTAAVLRPAPTGTAPSAGGKTSPSPTGSPLNPAAVVKGECVLNDGTQDQPLLRLAACAPGVFLVVGRFDGTDDVHRCDAVPGATHNFFYRTDPASLSFVLCLKRQ
jgi:hypothetical protein